MSVTACRNSDGLGELVRGCGGGLDSGVPALVAGLRYVPRRQYDQVVKGLKPIYTASDVDQALEALERFDQAWDKQLPPVVKAWRENWEYVVPFMAFPRT